jgi:hypothetical protein
MSERGWVPVWAMPNVTLDAPIEASHVALAPSNDERLLAIALRKPALATFLRAFRNEFETWVSPTIGLVRADAPRRVFTADAVAGLRDAVCISAIVAGQAQTMERGSPRGILHSDAFDVYPWFPNEQMDGGISARTPALIGMHTVDDIRPRTAPALGNRDLSLSYLDKPLLDALVARWERCFASGEESVEDRRLFRALDMARAASKTPGGIDASEHDAGRAVALWVSAFEILAHDGKRADLVRVLSLFNQPRWLRTELKAQDREVVHCKKAIQTNRAGALYKRLYDVRNAFLHGEEVTPKTLTLEPCKQSVLFFAAPLFRLALTAFLDLRIPEIATDDDGRWREMWARKPQRDAEGAILIADAPPKPRGQ